jgi:hypothetical protein
MSDAPVYYEDFAAGATYELSMRIYMPYGADVTQRC